jgi:hypothetical protein
MRHRALVLVALLVAVVSLGGCTPPGPVADYRFQDTRESSVGTAPQVYDIGLQPNVFTSEVVDSTFRRVLRFTAGNGVWANATQGVVSPTVYSMAVLFRFDTVTGYRRLLNVKDPFVDSGLYVRDGKLAFYPVAEGTVAQIDPSTYVQVVLTRDHNKTVTGYVNGVSQFQFNDTGNRATIDDPQDIQWFFDNTPGSSTGEYSGGYVARIRLWSRSLSSSEVANLSRLS